MTEPDTIQPGAHPDQGSASHVKRPWSVTFLVIGVLLLSAFYFTRLYAVVKAWGFWKQNLLPFSDWYLFITGLVWGVLFLILAVALWFGFPWGRSGMRIAAIAYLAYDWIERLILWKLNTIGPNWPFLASASLVLLIWVLWVLSRPAAKIYFGDKSHEQ